MRHGEGGINATENDFGFWRQRTQVVDHFSYTEIPIGHAGLDEAKIGRPGVIQKSLKFLSWNAEATKLAGNIDEDRRLWYGLRVKFAAPPRIASIAPGRH